MTFIILDNRKDSEQHGAQPEGFEHHGRLLAALDGVGEARDHSFHELTAPAAPHAQLELVHSRAYLDAIRAAVHESGPTGSSFQDEVVVYPGSWNAAVSAAGGAIRGVEALIRREARYAFLAARAPGHHAEHDRAMGFCLLSNAALAARVAELAGLKVAVLDIDIHNGNGTEQALAGKPNTLFTELFLEGHPENSYPYPAELRTPAPNAVRVGLPAGTSGATWVDGFEQGILPALRGFRPDIVICSAGFDCMEGDPVGGFGVTPADIFRVTQRLKEMGVPVLSLLEGGYRLENIRAGVAAHLTALR